MRKKNTYGHVWGISSFFLTSVCTWCRIWYWHSWWLWKDLFTCCSCWRVSPLLCVNSFSAWDVFIAGGQCAEINVGSCPSLTCSVLFAKAQSWSTLTIVLWGRKWSVSIRVRIADGLGSYLSGGISVVFFGSFVTSHLSPSETWNVWISSWTREQILIERTVLAGLYHVEPARIKNLIFLFVIKYELSRVCVSRTPLHYAAANCNYQCLFALVGSGASVNDLDERGCTPLHYAAASDTDGKYVFHLKSVIKEGFP